ncbi:uncharacterized protein LOC130055054 [Ostrea edulis]|uniref:uncharacterized protein LOC130055054 n=1 Tax=Ostrea edulis TaxID=37623 RepID=UPI0024AEC8C3|nr:uncharacterized protein LOC130055054 [Ostrea edulis]
MLMRLWKMNIIQFHNRNHHKYVILAHKLIAGISGWLPLRLQKDLLWNRTVNLSGGPGKNLEMDLVNEMLNKEFKESLKDAGGNLTVETVSRHSQLVGHLGRKLDKFFVNVSDVEEKQRVVSPARDFCQDIRLFINMLMKEKLFDYVKGRAFKSFPNFVHVGAAKDPVRLRKKSNS